MTYEPQPSPPAEWSTRPPAAPPQYAGAATARPQRPGWITTTAVILLAIGALSGLISVVLLLFGVVVGSAMSDFASLGVQSGFDGEADEATVNAVSGMMTGLFIAFAVIGILWAGSHVAAGVGILGGRGWARITGMVLSVIGLLFSVLGLLGVVASLGMASDPAFQDMYGPGMTPEAMRTGLLVNVLMIVPFAIGYVIALVALIRYGRFFDAPRAA